MGNCWTESAVLDSGQECFCRWEVNWEAGTFVQGGHFRSVDLGCLMFVTLRVVSSCRDSPSVCLYSSRTPIDMI
jgi:hypothetical protein